MEPTRLKFGVLVFDLLSMNRTQGGCSLVSGRTVRSSGSWGADTHLGPAGFLGVLLIILQM